uniref:Uncharacterized protein n=1 Tax=Populus trichocarpa TaxID=3694 RepID=A0A3N7GA57_POPTR
MSLIFSFSFLKLGNLCSVYSNQDLFVTTFS